MSSAQEAEVTTTGHGGHWEGRLIGLVVFGVGIGLLLMVFSIAYHLFTASPAAALGITITGDPKRDPGAAVIGSHFGLLIVKILLLFVMSAAASLISQKGVNLYFSCAQGAKTVKTTRPAAAITAEA